MLLTLGRDDQLDPATEEWVSCAEERMIEGELTPKKEPVTEGKAATEEAVIKTIEVAVKAATDR